MLGFTKKIMHSMINNMIDALAFLLIVTFYEVTVLQLPVPEIFNMLGMLVIIALGINIIVAPDKPAPAHL